MRRRGRRTMLECHAAGLHAPPWHRVRPNCLACREQHPEQCEAAATVRASTRRDRDAQEESTAIVSPYYGEWNG